MYSSESHLIPLDVASAQLHEADLTLSTLRLDAGFFRMDGSIPGRVSGKTIGKFRLAVIVPAVSSYKVEDEALIDSISVHDVLPVDDGIRMIGHLPVEIEITTVSRSVYVLKARSAFTYRRWGTWRPLPDTAETHVDEFRPKPD